MVAVALSEQLEALQRVAQHVAAHDLFGQEFVYEVQSVRLLLELLLLREFFELLVVFLGVGLQHEEADVVRQHVFLAGRKAELQSLGDGLGGLLEGEVEDAVDAAGLGVVVLLVVVAGHVGVESDLEVHDVGVVDVVLVDLLGDDEEPHVVLLLEHDPHLVEDELQFLPFVHRAVGLHLHLLQDLRRLHNIVFVLLALDDEHDAAGVLDLGGGSGTSRKIFLAQTSRMASMRRVRWGSAAVGSQLMASWIISTWAFLDWPRRFIR